MKIPVLNQSLSAGLFIGTGWNIVPLPTLLRDWKHCEWETGGFWWGQVNLSFG